MCAHDISSPSEWYHSTHGPTHACCPTSYLPSSCEPSPVPRITRPAHYKTSLSSGIHSPSATEKVAEGRVLPEKGPVQDVEVAHQSCEGSWRLWYHAISKDMWCAHILHTTRHFCRLSALHSRCVCVLPGLLACFHTCIKYNRHELGLGANTILANTSCSSSRKLFEYINTVWDHFAYISQNVCV